MWLLYLDKLTAWLWQDNEGAARWTLILDDTLRRASINHPPRTPAGLKNQVSHQSRLKHALVHAFAPHYPTTISLHPNTEALDVSGNIVPFGTNLFRAIGIEIVPEDTVATASHVHISSFSCRSRRSLAFSTEDQGFFFLKNTYTYILTFA